MTNEAIEDDFSNKLIFMELGYRIIRSEDVGAQPLRFAQISLWREANWGVADGEEAVRQAIAIARACKARGIRTVFHPLEYPLADAAGPRTLGVMRRLAAACDLGIIIHDEGGAGGTRLTSAQAGTYEKNVTEISGLCRLSIENSYNSGDSTWFWERFVVPAPPAVSITLDIGHLELAGLDSVSFIRDLPERLVERIAFAHLHHHDASGPHAVKDHQPLVPGCREIEALEVLLARKSDIRVVLELDAARDGMERSIELVKDL
jgi:sugar phosphate isomerase/epimerase